MNSPKIHFFLAAALLAFGQVALVPAASAQTQPVPPTVGQTTPAQKPPEKSTPVETGSNKPAVQTAPKKNVESGSICKVDPDLCPKGKPPAKEPGKAAP